jgi:hypothetical protein
MPTKQRLRRDEPYRARRTRQGTRCGSEEGTINNPECRTLDLTAEHIELVTQDHQFDVFDVRTAPAADEQAE